MHEHTHFDVVILHCYTPSSFHWWTTLTRASWSLLSFGTSEDALHINLHLFSPAAWVSAYRVMSMQDAFCFVVSFHMDACCIESPVPGPCSFPSFHILALDSWTDIQIIAGVFHRHDRKLLLAVWCLFYVFRQRRMFICNFVWSLGSLRICNWMLWSKQV